MVLYGLSSRAKIIVVSCCKFCNNCIGWEKLKQSFAEETNQSDSMDTAEFNEGFLNYYEEYKQELVDAENYQLAE